VDRFAGLGGRPVWVISGEDLDQRPVAEHRPAEVPNAAIPGRWVNAIDPRVGDILFSRDGRRVPVTNVSPRHAEMKVYNLRGPNSRTPRSGIQGYSCIIPVGRWSHN
jgi:hypothetical protein